MTTQSHPPTDAAQLAQARTATQAAQALADQWQKKADEQRAQIDALTHANIDLWSQCTTTDARRAAAAADAATSIRLMESAQAERNALRADNARLLAIIGADAPVCVEASRRRTELREAIAVLKEPMQARIKL